MNLVALLSMTLISHQASAPPAFYYDKTFDTPRLCQTDPDGNYANGGKNYCAPTAAANAIVFLARHGYPSLLSGDTMEDAYALVRQLASSDFIGTEGRDGTNDTAMILGISKYLQTCGVEIKRFEYEGYRPLFGRLGGTDHATTVNLNWVKEKTAQPNTVVWLHLGYYSYVSPGTYKRYNGHYINVVGSGWDGAVTDPNLLIIRNPLAKKLSRPVDPKMMMPMDEVILKPTKDVTLIGDYKGLPRRANDLYTISGIAVSKLKGDQLTLVDGALALELIPPQD